MYLVQMLLPLYDGSGRKISRARFAAVMDTLTRRFGGVTAYVHAPAEGQWARRGAVDLDQIITLEVMAAKRDARWWKQYRKSLEAEFEQEVIVVRLLKAETL